MTNWQDFADAALAGRALTPIEGLAVLRADDDAVLDLLAAAYRVRRRYFGRTVHLNVLINARSGRCGEDCGYCSQSRVSSADIPLYALVSEEQILAGAATAAERQAKTYCIATSGVRLSDVDLNQLCRAAEAIKRRWAMKLCVSPGLLDDARARRLASAGVDRINHNLNTSARYYAQICSTHAYEDRLATLAAVRAAGMEICCGGIIGMGESDEDVVELALRTGALQAEAVPLNFFQPIVGTPLGGQDAAEAAARRAGLNPRYCLKALALFRFTNPRSELRIAAGREMHLGALQPLGLFAANSIFLGGYLTTQGQSPTADYRMIGDLGFEALTE